MNTPKVLIVLTSHNALGETGEQTGFWLDEFAAPYFAFKDAGARVTLASIKGGQPPLDPKSALAEWQTDATRRYFADAEAQARLADTLAISAIDARDFDALFFPGGHGPMWDYPGNAALARLVERFDRSGKPVGAVCHGPVALVDAKRPDGAPLVAGRRVAAFANS